MSAQDIMYLILGGLAGGFINGFAGTGTALFALGFFLAVLEPVSAVAVVATLSVVSGIQGLWIVRSEILTNTPRLLRFLIPGIVGIPIGILLLSYVDAGVLRLAIGVFLIAYGGFFGLRRNLPKFTRRTPIIDSLIGFVSGILGGFASLAGALPTIWMSMRPWTKTETRSILQPFNMTVIGITMLTLAARGAFDHRTLMALAVVLPTCLIAARIGIYAFHHVSDAQFRRTLIILCLALGTGILLQDLGVFS